MVQRQEIIDETNKLLKKIEKDILKYKDENTFIEETLQKLQDNLVFEEFFYDLIEQNTNDYKRILTIYIIKLLENKCCKPDIISISKEIYDYEEQLMINKKEEMNENLSLPLGELTEEEQEDEDLFEIKEEIYKENNTDNLKQIVIIPTHEIKEKSKKHKIFKKKRS